MKLCRPYTNNVYNTDIKSSIERLKGEGYVEVFEGRDLPSLEHKCTSDGLWRIPQETKEDIKAKRTARYKEETDELLVDIVSSERRGQDVMQKQAEWESRIAKIQSDLPYPESVTPAHYTNVVPPTKEGAENVGGLDGQSGNNGGGAETPEA